MWPDQVGQLILVHKQGDYRIEPLGYPVILGILKLS